MNTPEFMAAALALLLAPGPTNTLLAVAGAQRGWRGALPLIPAEVAGYTGAILAVATVGQSLLHLWPGAATVLTGLAALWVMVLAFRLWRNRGPEGPAAAIGARTVLVTTLLNPKAAVVALALLPGLSQPGFWPRLTLFLGLVAAAALLWAGMGALARGDGPRPGRLRLLRRIASVWLAGVSVLLMLSLSPT
ncbi:LysE family translocator [Neotabrizicola sp. VNH66]|uniref:LysE family translocator n=1 Tax=Neotabrizicola sp. VNH66 TaxID=3400918 RepID=UPI003C114914